jgi:transketolase
MTMSPTFGPRRAEWITVDRPDDLDLSDAEVRSFETFDLLYRTLTAILFNFAQSGHPGGSVSAGRIMTGVLFDAMDYDIGDPLRPDADLLSFAAGHKATGLYAMWGLRDEITRIARPDLLPERVEHRLRLEDLLGFRRNPTTSTPRFVEFGSKPLDGHPTPATPFVKIATGPSGVGVGSSLGLAFTLADRYGPDSPRVHLLEGEGGLTPGRVYESLASASASGLSNAVCHLDWNQASIDSDRVTREGARPGEYVQWDPMELFFLHDWNVVEVPDGFDVRLVLSAQRRALEMDNGQPTALVYRTEKGWRYGITGKKSHGGGHPLCSDAYHATIAPVFGREASGLPCRGEDGEGCSAESSPEELEACYWATLERLRELLETEYREMCDHMTARLATARNRLDARERTPRGDAPDAERIYAVADPEETPGELALEPGTKIPLRKQLGKVLGYLNQASGGALLYGAADLLDSTAVSGTGKGFPDGYWHFRDNPGARALSVGGICEDGLSCILSGTSAFGFNVGVGASYGAFIAPLGHIPARVHAISSQMRREVEGEDTPYHPFVLICGHAGMKTGEDGPTHADPQALQLHVENYVPGTAVTLTPWEPGEIWPALSAAFQARPAVIVPFVTRPGEPVLDREEFGLAPAEAAAQGVYRLVAAEGERDGTLVLQGSAVTYEFVRKALPALRSRGIELDVFHVTSPELFDRLSPEEQDRVFPREQAHEAMGVTDFTLPTLYRWVRSDLGLRHTLHPFRKGHYLGSGPGEAVVFEAGLHGNGQLRVIEAYVTELAEARADRGVPV